MFTREFTFEVKGLQEMQRELMKLPEKIQRKVLHKAVREGAKVIRDLARPKAPIGTKIYRDWRGRPHAPGLLRKSGVVHKKLSLRQARRAGADSLFGVGFSKRAFYGRFVERGKGKKHHMTPRPFVVPTFEAAAHRAAEIIRDGIGRGLAAIAAELKGITVK